MSFAAACEKASSDDDVRQVFNVSAVYELPFGAGKPLYRSRALGGRSSAAGS